MSESTNHSGSFDQEMAEYLQTFLDETEEQLDDLVETMLLLEGSSTNEVGLNEAFRLIHSIKGAAGMMGLDHITVLTHHLENRFERFRSGTEQIDEPTMNLVLRCIDFLRQSTDRLRAGEPLGNPAELLAEMKQLEARVANGESEHNEQKSDPGTDDDADNTALLDQSPAEQISQEPAGESVEDGTMKVVVQFRDGLQLADLKAQLILNRIAGLGTIKDHSPRLEDLSDDFQIRQFEIWVDSTIDLDRLRAAADVDGVESVELPEAVAAVSPPIKETPEVESEEQEVPLTPQDEESKQDDLANQTVPEPLAPEPHVPEPLVKIESIPDDDGIESPASVDSVTDPESQSAASDTIPPQPPDAQPHADSMPSVDSQGSGQKTAKLTETMRVDIDRLDDLMNLAGELVVNRAHFVQISGQINPAHRKPSTLNRVREFCDSLRQMIDNLDDDRNGPVDRNALVARLRSGLELLDEHSESWDNNRGYLDRFGDAIDQLSRVSQSLQKGVLDTRMVPVGPLFSRFKRVTRDLSKERGKQVHLAIHGEKTELDKRMIDELGDPLIHLVRNSIDHGLESTEARLACGKPEIGTISLEATHSGNNVYIHVRDDGGGIDVARVKSKIVSNGILSQTAAEELTDEQAFEYIWHPGFSTAQEITDVSGRGVGMDVVLTRIRRLNGSVEIQSVPQQGTQFTIRLPLTLAIINCLLVKLHGVVFSMSIEDVREIVSLDEDQIVTVQGKQTFEVRDEYLPLVSIDEIFHWNPIDYGHLPGAVPLTGEPTDDLTASESNLDLDAEAKKIQVVVLQTAGKTMGLRVEELLGSQDMVIKSLSDNFVNIQGLSGASILGDGSVCLMLDVSSVFHMATKAMVESEPEGTLH